MIQRNLKLRLFHAVGAQSLAPVLTAAIQLVSVPVFLHFWVLKRYWRMASR